MEKKQINYILIASSLIIVSVISVFMYVYLNPESTNIESENKPEEFFCGTESTPPEKLKGKEIFNINCAACHRMNATDNILKNVFKRMPNEEYFEKFITSEDSLQKANDKYAKNLQKEFPIGFKHNFKFSREEVENLKKYIE